MIDESIAVIDQEEKADDEKHAWCAKEQADSNADSDDKEDDIYGAPPSYGRWGLEMRGSDSNIHRHYLYLN